MIAYQLKITLKGTQPSLWRRVLIPANLAMESLHQLIQLLMEWEDCHLYQFRKNDVVYSSAEVQAASDYPVVDYEGMPVQQLLSMEKDTLTYIYDLSDWWEMDIILEKIIQDSDITQPRLLDGEQPAPPESCGGLSGYYQLLTILRDPAHPEYNEIRDWVGEYYDINLFDKEFVEEELEEFLFDYIYNGDEESIALQASPLQTIRNAVAKFWNDHNDKYDLTDFSIELIRDLSRGTQFFKHGFHTEEYAAAIVYAIAQVNLLFDEKHSILSITEEEVATYYNVKPHVIEKLIGIMEQDVIIEPIFSAYLVPQVVEKNKDVMREIERSMGLD